MTESFRFNLIDERFLPCLGADGAYQERSIRDALLQAPDIRELWDQSPLVTVALHRLLLAILHRIFGPETVDDWERLWAAGQFDARSLTAYLDRWHERFDLFHETWPFYQTPDFTANQRSPVSRLVRDMARSHNATLFDHTMDHRPGAMSSATAARHLIAEQAYALNEGRGYSGTKLPAGVCVLVNGRSLFETLMLNLMVLDESFPFPSVNDAPAWERDAPTVERGPVPDGYLDYLTWQSRRLRLHAELQDGHNVVRYISYAQGRKLNLPAHYFEPMMAYERVKRKGDRPIGFKEERFLWQDSEALLRFSETAQFKGPSTLAFLGELVEAGLLPSSFQYELMAAGLRTDGKGKVFFWRSERLPLPLAYLSEPELVDRLRQALELADEVAKILNRAVRRVAEEWLTFGQRQADKKSAKDILRDWSPCWLYWSRLEVPFRQFITDLGRPATAEQRDRLIAHWICHALRPAAVEAYEKTAGSLDASARTLRAAAIGRHQLHWGLNSTTKPHRERLHEPSISP